MRKIFAGLAAVMLIFLCISGIAGCSFPGNEKPTETASFQTVSGKTESGSDFTPDEDGSYTSMSEVAAYIHTYGHLPDNYITKSKAKKLGWNAQEGNLWEVAPGKSIGGDNFSNYEGKLPKASGRKYRECDIDYNGGTRNAKRLVYSNDGLIFYTQDHYKSYTQLY